MVALQGKDHKIRSCDDWKVVPVYKDYKTDGCYEALGLGLGLGLGLAGTHCGIYTTGNISLPSYYGLVGLLLLD